MAKKFLTCLLFLTSCASYMTQQSFELVSTGSPIALVEEQYGRPYDTEEYPDGTKQVRYIERIATSSTATDYRYYIFLINSSGRIIQKRCEIVGSTIDFKTP